MTQTIKNTPFNIRGVFPQYNFETDYLVDALKLAFLISDHKTASAYSIDKKLGLILYWTDKSAKRDVDVHKFITPLTAEQVYPQVEAFLKSYFNDDIEIELEVEDEEYDDDEVTNVEGWRVYTGQWNRVDGDDYAMIAIKPAYDNYGK